MSAHGFRSHCSTILNESESSNSDAIERQLSHVPETGSERPTTYARISRKGKDDAVVRGRIGQLRAEIRAYMANQRADSNDGSAEINRKAI